MHLERCREEACRLYRQASLSTGTQTFCQARVWIPLLGDLRKEMCVWIEPDRGPADWAGRQGEVLGSRLASGPGTQHPQHREQREELCAWTERQTGRLQTWQANQVRYQNTALQLGKGCDPPCHRAERRTVGWIEGQTGGLQSQLAGQVRYRCTALLLGKGRDPPPHLGEQREEMCAGRERQRGCL